ncbi:universal stress protein [Mangrovimonas sp. YM274]|uniref:universal stress protein n=1 Tax=Mangrovimonas sp. YM274 TaxID=3070660 RepID=UPI0027DC976E|nr:universal stress protein [Mangrovimonas sp. YM274]WMI67883.1 universal stress protein [Mangrovimonas sp. YM274]
MKTISTILVPFDFSEVAQNALKYATHFVENNPQAKIILAHVVETEQTPELEAKLNDIVQLFGKNLKHPITPVVVKGKMIDALLDIEHTNPIDLVIMGTCPKGTDCNLQTKTSEFVLVSKSPVIVIPDGYTKITPKKISLIIDQEEIHNKKLLEVLLDVARRFNAMVDVLTIVNKEEKHFGYSENDENNENAIIYYLENFYSHHAFIEDDNIIDGIFSYVDHNDIDLIAILPKNHAIKPIASEGKLTRALSQQSKVPLLAIDL